MKVTPFFVPGRNQNNTPMGIDYHIVPGVHALFFGPVECARHTFPQLVDDPDGSLLIVNDVQTSLGSTEDLVREAVEEISAADPGVRAFLFCTACQTAFMGIDLEGLCLDLHAETGLYFGHVEANRMSSENIPGHTRKDIPGGDRYHSRLALFRMLRQVAEPHAGRDSAGEDGSGSAEGDGGVLVLTRDALDPANELLKLADVPGVGWVRGVGDCASFEDFLSFRDARVTIATSMPWKEVGEWMRDEFGIPTLYLPTSYSLEEVDGYYGQLADALAEGDVSLEAFEAARRSARDAAQTAVGTTLERQRPLELDLRLANRPFSLVEALQGYGFQVRDFMPSMIRVQHKEADDLPAFERLSQKYPAIGRRFASRPKSHDRKKRGTRTKNLQRAGRWVAIPGEGKVARVPEETAWWGYASIVELMRQIRETREAFDSVAPPGMRAPGGQQSARKGKWSL